MHRVLPALLAALQGAEQPPTALEGLQAALPSPLRAVALLVVDGMGARQIAEHAELAPNLAAATHGVLHAPFPSTTATSLTSIGTGRPPGEHGIVGYSFKIPGDPRPFFPLSWSFAAHDADRVALDEVHPETLQPEPTVFERARGEGVRPVTILRDEYVGSGLTRAALRGGDVVIAPRPSTVTSAITGALSDASRPTLVYAHYGRLDTVGHRQGPDSEAWRKRLGRIDRALVRFADDLPDGTALVVTADHGMVAMPDEGYTELADAPQLMDGVAMLAGEPRARQLHTVVEAADDVATAWREHCGDVAHVLTRQQAVDAGWFGPMLTEHIRERIGEVIVAARKPGIGWVHRELDLRGGRLAGHHGAATSDELEVPLIVLTS